MNRIVLISLCLFGCGGPSSKPAETTPVIAVAPDEAGITASHNYATYLMPEMQFRRCYLTEVERDALFDFLKDEFYRAYSFGRDLPGSEAMVLETGSDSVIGMMFQLRCIAPGPDEQLVDAWLRTLFQRVYMIGTHNR